ncbi:MAG TPA: sortase [Acidimicrobiales bacterium]|nr:sortase [Acidimicrobiales bacterium]
MGLAVLGLVVLVLAVAAVLYAVGPFIHDRDQRNLMAAERLAIAHAAAEAGGLYGPTVPTVPPTPGSPVGILAIPAIGVQQAVVEGAGPAQTASGPGHVPGTAGLGQPGNAAVVGRRSAYGGPFGGLGELRRGDRVLAATTQGESVYVVDAVRTVALVTREPAPTAGPASSGPVRTGASGPVRTGVSSGGDGKPSSRAARPAVVNLRNLFGPSTHDQLTLVTSATDAPWNGSRAVVVVARMKGQPYAPTPQEARSLSQQGNGGDPGAATGLVLALLVLAAALAGAVTLYRRSTLATAYLLGTAPLLAGGVLAAVAASRLLPGWL